MQLHAGFPLDAAGKVLPYLADLGVSHVYLSPCLQAVPGSQHGYDVTDPTIESQVIELKNSGADTLFNASTAKFGAQAIRKVADLNWKPLHVIIQAISSLDNVLKPAGLEQSKDLLRRLDQILAAHGG